MDSLYSIVEFFVTGGPFMYPILIVFAVGAAIAVERYINSGESAPVVFDEDLNAQVRAEALARLATQQDSDAIDQYRVASEKLQRATDEIESRLSEQEDLLVALEESQAALEAELERLEELTWGHIGGNAPADWIVGWIETFPEAAWTPIPYWLTGGADVAERLRIARSAPAAPSGGTS